MSILDCNKLTNHSNGINDSYYKPTDEDLLKSYLKVVDHLTIEEEYKLEKQLLLLEEKNKDNENLIKLKLLEKEERLTNMENQIKRMLSVINSMNEDGKNELAGKLVKGGIYTPQI